MNKMKTMVLLGLGLLLLPTISEAQVVHELLPDRSVLSKLKLKSLTIKDQEQASEAHPRDTGTNISKIMFTRWGDIDKGKFGKYKYDAKGRIVGSKGEYERSVCTYFADGRRMDTVWNDGNVDGPNLDYYSKDGLLDSSYYNSNHRWSYMRYTKDAQGRVIEAGGASTREGPYGTAYTQEWNEKGEKVLYVSNPNRPDDKATFQYRYDSKGRMIYWESRSARFYHTYDVTLDARGLPVKAVSIYANGAEAPHKSVLTFTFL